MKKAFFLLFLQTLSGILLAQLTDNFSGTDLATFWQGQRDKFTINSGELQLNDTDAGTNNSTLLYALAPTSTAEETTWQFKLRYVFSPSSSNFANVILAADSPSADNFNGYYVKIGGISGSDDAIELYRQDGSASTLLLSGAVGAVANDPVNVSVLVTRTATGQWTLETDYTGGDNFDPEGSITDATYTSGLYFGLNCNYTSTRNTAFFFDDIEVSPLVEDNDAPVITEVDPLSATELRLRFNEPVVLSGTTTFSVNNGIGAPSTVTPTPQLPNELILTFGTPFVNLQAYVLTATAVGDLSGNISGEQEIGFEFLLAEAPMPGDLIITEIFPDPTPPVGLPDFEYIELYNNSEKVLQLEGIGLSTGSTPRDVDAYVLLPAAYVVLCDRDAAADFASFGETATLASFPALTNGGDELILTNTSGQIITELTYDADWYQDPLKAAGGYAIERISLDEASDCPGNWRASDDNAGGTPGGENSVFGSALETTPPGIRSAIAISETEILVRFDEVLDNVIEVGDLFSISDGITIGAGLLGADRRSVRLFLEMPLVAGQLYDLTSLAGISDCLGNTRTVAEVIPVGLAVRPTPGDLIINEILFNPYSGGVDFVELHNPTDAVVELTGLRLRNEAISSGTIGTTVEEELVILPGDYIVLTANPDNILLNYTVPNPDNLIENNLPSLADKEGNLTIFNAAFEELDALTYTEDWHSRLLRDRNGVSLERLRAEGVTQNEGNWSSAASTVGFATPTGRNSQDRQAVITPTADFFTLPEKTFSPDGDSFQDVLEIQYTTDQSGYAGQIFIFDERGRLVRNLDGLELLAGEGSFLWDGTTDDGEKARMGIYILVAEIFTPTGETIKEKHPLVLAGQLD